MIVGLDHGQLAAPPGGELQARSFCGELGLTELPKPPALEARGGMWFAVGASRQLHIGIEPEFVAARRAHPALTLDSTAALGALAGKLARPGCEPTWDADPPRARRFSVDDPFANRLELLARGG